MLFQNTQRMQQENVNVQMFYSSLRKVVMKIFDNADLFSEIDNRLQINNYCCF